MANILDSLEDQIVFVDTGHIIRYMNASARKHHTGRGDLMGKSIFACHNARSCEIIKNIYSKLEAGSAEEFIYQTEKQRIYMRAVRDDVGNLLGYYERYVPLAVN